MKERKKEGNKEGGKTVKNVVNSKDVQRVLFERLQAHGFKSRMVPVEAVWEVNNEIRRRYETGELAPEVWQEYSQYFDVPSSGVPVSGRSILVVASPQPKVEVGFTRNGRVHYFTIPPTYLHHTDDEVDNVIRSALEPLAMNFQAARLPEKLLAVRTGLALYGRNNISYVPGMGSFYRIRAYYTDLPFEGPGLSEAVMLDRCRDCRACVKSCPTGAISTEHSVINAGRCLTFFNELPIGWPTWVKESWDTENKCLVGCMKCQMSCPENRKNKDWLEQADVFSQHETGELMTIKDLDRLSPSTVEKLDRLYLTEYLPTLARNLAILFEADCGIAETAA